MLHVHTANVRAYTGDDGWDIMRGTADDYIRRGAVSPGEPWAPPRWLLGVALGRCNAPAAVPPPPRRSNTVAFFAWYAERYRISLEASEVAYPYEWAWLQAQDSVTFLCGCPNPSACHRVVAGEYGAERGLWTYEGER